MVQTLRAWMAEPCEDIVTYIDSKGIRDAILEAICLDDTSPTARVPDDRPRDPFLVDLAVLEREWDRVVAHFPSIVGSINDVFRYPREAKSTSAIFGAQEIFATICATQNRRKCLEAIKCMVQQAF